MATTRSGNNSGLFLTFEGPDGGGKTTQAALLESALVARGVATVRTREPGGDRVGERVREMLLSNTKGGDTLTAQAELLLFAAARAQNVASVVRPALASGSVVISDRFVDSTVAYQGHGRGLSLAFIDELNRFATNGLFPDRTFLLDLPPRQAIARHAVEKRNRLDNEPGEFHERVRVGFLALAQENPERFVVLDGAQNVALVARAIQTHVFALLGLPPESAPVAGNDARVAALSD